MVVLTAKNRGRAISGHVLLSDDLLKELRRLIKKEYPTEIDDRKFVDASFLKRCFSTTMGLYEMLGLRPYGIA